MLQFFVDCDPPKATSQLKGVSVMASGKIHFYKKKKIQASEDYLTWHFKKYAPMDIPEGPLKVMLGFQFPYTAAELKKKSLPDSVPCITKPDLDNAAKSVLDVMTSLGFWKDDAQIYSLVLTKRKAKRTGIYVKIQQV